MFLKRIKQKFSRFYNTVKKPKVAIPLFFIFWVFVGVILIYFSQSDSIAIVVILAGAVLSVVIERMFDFARTFVIEYKDSHPIRKILETIAKEDTVIYISPFYRDLHKPQESKLYRYERDRVSLPLISGTQYVYGRGDAIAMSFVLRAINKISPKEHITIIEDDWQALEKWGRTAICIGAHNAKSREIFAKFTNTYYRFAMNYRAIVRNTDENTTPSSKKTYVPGVFQRKAVDSSVVDYGFIVKLRDQFHPDKKPIIVIAGIGDWGTAGAAYYFENNYHDLPYDQDTFGILIEVPSGYQSARKVVFETVSDFIYDK